jgi:hypothetical protein
VGYRGREKEARNCPINGAERRTGIGQGNGPAL